MIDELVEHSRNLNLIKNCVVVRILLSIYELIKICTIIITTTTLYICTEILKHQIYLLIIWEFVLYN